MSRIEELEQEIDDLNRQMGEAYDAGDMCRWEHLREKMEKVGAEYRELCNA